VNRKQPPARAEGEESQGFEASLERLEVIVQELEGGGLTLEESLARYEEGVRLSQRLTQRLDAAEKQIERLNEQSAAEPERALAFDEEPTGTTEGKGGARAPGTTRAPGAGGAAAATGASSAPGTSGGARSEEGELPF